MIKYNNNTINDLNFDASNVIKVYRNNAIVFYKISGESPTPEYKVCFAVVDDISQYADREFEDVYDNATEKWYKLNNLNQYEEYGVYGSGRGITYYKGKLTIDDETTSRLPQGYTEVEYVQNNTQGAYLNLGVKLYGAIGNSYEITARYKSQYMPNWSSGEYLQTIINSEGVSSPYYGMAFRYAYSTHTLELAGGDKSDITWTNTDNGDGTSALTISSNSTVHADQVPLGLFASYQGNYTTPYRWSNTTIYSMQITLNNELVRDLVPCIRDNDSMVGMYDLVNDVFYYPPNYQSYQLVAGELVIEPTKTYEYEWNGSEWVNLGEVSGSTATLPNKSFVLNYNAKNYNATTNSIPYTSGQSKAIDAIQNYGTNTIIDHSSDGYISVTANTRLTISGGTTSMYRTNTETGCTMTIVSKARTTKNYSILTCRGSAGTNQMNWMWRYPSNGIFLHGSSSYNKVTYYTTTSASPITASVRVSWNGSVQQQINDWTNNGSYNGAFQYGSYTNDINSNGALFCDYLTNNDEFWQGDFYWAYMSQEVLSDEEIQQVINYNEGGGGESEYPKYYSEKSDPLNNLTFNTLAEAQTYAKANCVYDGMKARIDGKSYYFDSSDENGWVEYSGTIWLDPSATNALFSIGHYWGENYKMVITTYLSGSYSGDYGSFWQGNGHTPIELSFYSNGFYYDMHGPTSTTAPNVNTSDYSYRIVQLNAFSNYQNSQVMEITLTYGSFKAELADSGTLIYSSGSTKTGYSWYSGLYQANIGLNNANAKCHLSHIQIYNGNNELVNDFKFIKNNGVVGSQEISIYDSVTNTTYNNTNSNTPVYHIET